MVFGSGRTVSAYLRLIWT